jgi:cytochrome c biogenesis protein CcdA
MIGLPFLFALQAGMITTVSPCAFPMLPAWIGYHLGVHDEGFSQTPPARRAIRAIGLSLLATLGFIVVSGTAGLIIALGGRLLIRDAIPQAATALGGGLVVLGFVLLIRGKSFSLPVHMSGSSRRGNVAVFLFGMAYGIAAVGCTLPLFLLVIVGALSAAGTMGAILQFGVYASGMGLVLMAVTVGAALFRGVVATVLRRAMPYVEWVSTALVVQAGAYIVAYWQSDGGIKAYEYLSTIGPLLLAITVAVTLARRAIVGRRQQAGSEVGVG